MDEDKIIDVEAEDVVEMVEEGVVEDIVDEKTPDTSKLEEKGLVEVLNSAKGEKSQEEDDDDVVRCPRCGSKNVEFVTYQANQGFSAEDACCGYMLCGPLGLLCGTKEKEEAKTVRKCKKCCHEF